MKSEFAVVLAVFGFALTLFLSCADNSLPEFPKFVGESEVYSSSLSEVSSSGFELSSSSVEFSSSGEASSSSVELSSSSSAELSSSGEASSSSVALSSSSSVGLSSSSEASSSSVALSSSSFLETVSSSSSVQSSSSALKECIEIFNPANIFCYDGILYDKCDGIEYNPTIYICTGKVAIPAKCGGQSYNPVTQGCCNNVIFPKSTQRCESSILETKCGSKWYDATKEFCTRSESNPQIVELCGGKGYDTRVKFCSGTTILDKCGGTVPYDPTIKQCCGNSIYTIATHFCTRSESNPRIVELCGGKGYDTKTKYCSNGTVKDYLIDIRDGKKYKTVVIGTQTWMAENLNYNATNSICNGDNTGGDSQGNCVIYGRLYNWSTAMANSASSDANPSNVRGVCPLGWHLPSDTEWDDLMETVGGQSTAGIVLKAVGKWSSHTGVSIGTDYYGFSALPGGMRYLDGSSGSVGQSVNWWSSTEENASYAYSRYISINYDKVGRANYDKRFSFSVRCLQDL